MFLQGDPDPSPFAAASNGQAAQDLPADLTAQGTSLHRNTPPPPGLGGAADDSDMDLVRAAMLTVCMRLVRTIYMVLQLPKVAKLGAAASSILKLPTLLASSSQLVSSTFHSCSSLTQSPAQEDSGSLASPPGLPSRRSGPGGLKRHSSTALGSPRDSLPASKRLRTDAQHGAGAAEATLGTCSMLCLFAGLAEHSVHGACLSDLASTWIMHSCTASRYLSAPAPPTESLLGVTLPVWPRHSGIVRGR